MAVIQLSLALAASAQETRYIYDAVGRLIGVVEPSGRIVIYDYDEVGNLLAVRRLDATSPVAITFVNPGVGIVGTSVEILGVGFSTVPTGNQISFNGVPAPVLTATGTYLSTRVPPGATSGPITVTTAIGSATSPSPFRVPRLTIFPVQTTVAIGRPRQFAATVVESSDQRITWDVNGIEGGNDLVGRISVGGVYDAPAEVPTPPDVQVRARSVLYPPLFAIADVVIVPPGHAVVALPFDVRLVRPAVDPGGLPPNLTVASPPSIHLTRPGLGDPGGLLMNTLVAGPPLISVVRSGMGDADGLPLNVTVAAPSFITLTRPGAGTVDGLMPNVTVAQPHHIQVKRQ